MVRERGSHSESTLLKGVTLEDWKINLVYWICCFGVLMAFLELGQDYVSSMLNDNPFHLGQSLAYKLFWLLFLPFSIALVLWFERGKDRFTTSYYLINSALMVSLATLLHLVLFSVLLHLISSIAYEEAWSLYYLITEKLSTRLYLAFSVYILFSFGYQYWQTRKNESDAEEQGNHSRYLTIKNGRSRKLLEHDNINWISSDGPYLSIHTGNKDYVILNSLKSIIADLPENFKRIHRSTIVNTDLIDELVSRGNGDYDVVMECGTTLRLSRNYSDALQELLR